MTVSSLTFVVALRFKLPFRRSMLSDIFTYLCNTRKVLVFSMSFLYFISFQTPAAHPAPYDEYASITTIRETCSTDQEGNIRFQTSDDQTCIGTCSTGLPSLQQIYLSDIEVRSVFIFYEFYAVLIISSSSSCF